MFPFLLWKCAAIVYYFDLTLPSVMIELATFRLGDYYANKDDESWVKLTKRFYLNINALQEFHFCEHTILYH